MKVDWNKRYTTIAIYSFIVICCSIVFYNIMDKMSAFTDKISWIMATLQPFIIGFVIAYLLNFILVFFEEKVLVFDSIKNMKKKGKRGISILLTYTTAFIILSVFVQFVLPQVADSIAGLGNDIPSYVTNVTNVTKLLEELTKEIKMIGLHNIYKEESKMILRENKDKTKINYKNRLLQQSISIDLS